MKYLLHYILFAPDGQSGGAKNTKATKNAPEQKADQSVPAEDKKAVEKTDIEKNISDSVIKRVHQMQEQGLTIPPGYSPENALKSAYLMLTQQVVKKDSVEHPVLSVVTRESIANTLLDMVIQGLSPIKRQCYFIPYGNKLSLSRSYHGTVAVAKRLSRIKDAFAQVIYQDDVFAYTINPVSGNKVLVNHEQHFQNIDIEKIVGAYAVVTFNDTTESYLEVMNLKQIEAAWRMGKQFGGQYESKVHKNFKDEMCKKTVLNRACKYFINTSDDSDILIDSVHRTTDAEYNDKQLPEAAYEEVEEEIKNNANKETIDFDVPVKNEIPPVKDIKEPATVNGQANMFNQASGPGF